MEKVSDPSRYELMRALDIPEGSNVVLVDDIVTSGETLDGLAEVLAMNRVKVDRVAALGAIQGGHEVYPTQTKELAMKLGKASGRRVADAEKDIRLAHAFSRANLLKRAIKEADSEPNRIHQVISGKAADLRSAVGGGKAVRPQPGELGQGVRPEGAGGTGDVRGIPDVQPEQGAAGKDAGDGRVSKGPASEGGVVEDAPPSAVPGREVSRGGAESAKPLESGGDF